MNAQIELSIAVFKALNYRAVRDGDFDSPWRIQSSMPGAPYPYLLRYSNSEEGAWKAFIGDLPQQGPVWNRTMAIQLLESLPARWTLSCNMDVGMYGDTLLKTAYAVTIEGVVLADACPTACEAICRAFVKYKEAQSKHD